MTAVSLLCRSCWGESGSAGLVLLPSSPSRQPIQWPEGSVSPETGVSSSTPLVLGLALSELLLSELLLPDRLRRRRDARLSSWAVRGGCCGCALVLLWTLLLLHSVQRAGRRAWQLQAVIVVSRVAEIMAWLIGTGFVTQDRRGPEQQGALLFPWGTRSHGGNGGRQAGQRSRHLRRRRGGRHRREEPHGGQTAGGSHGRNIPCGRNTGSRYCIYWKCDRLQITPYRRWTWFHQVQHVPGSTSLLILEQHSSQTIRTERITFQEISV